MAMIEPVTKDLKWYEGADFIFQFRIKDATGAAIDVSAWVMTMFIADKVSGAQIADLSTAGGSPGITVNAGDNYLVTAKIVAASTRINKEKLTYELDATLPSGEKQRRIVGDIPVTKTRRPAP